MSKLEKLNIQGVRSFGVAVPESIAFHTPLTLIVGYNGSGKTTIIECLKYATTGQLPPNSTGGAFIHDPELDGEKSVKAQVKVKFHSISKKDLTVSRLLELTVHKTKRTQKTIDSTLAERDGQRNVLSKKSAEVNSMVPQEFGVSSAILDNVIFCHQDDSLWPLSEASNLKKKFDDIFEAGRYTKAVTNLKDVRKAKKADLDKMKHVAATDIQTLKQARECEATLMQLYEARDETAQTLSKLAKQIDGEVEVGRRKQLEIITTLAIVSDLQTTEKQLSYKQDRIRDLENRIEELTESDEQLKEILTQYKGWADRLVTERDQKTEKFHELQAELKICRDKLSLKVSEEGRLQSDKDRYERQLAEQSQKIREAAELHRIRGYDGEIDDRQANAFRDRILLMLNEKKLDLQRLQRDNGAELDDRTSLVRDCETRKATRAQEQKSAKQRLQKLDKDVAILKSHIRDFDQDENAEAILQGEKREIEGRMERIKSEKQDADLDRRIQAENNRLAQLQAEQTRLRQEMSEASKQAGQRAQLDMAKAQLTKNRKELDAQINSWGERFSSLIGDSWKPASVEVDFREAFKKQEDRVAADRREKEAARIELRQLESSLGNVRQDVNMKRADKESSRFKVLKALKNINPDASLAQYVGELKGLEDDLREAETEVSLFNELKKFFEKVLDTATRQNKCHLCDRDFKTQSDVKTRMLQKISKKISDEGRDEAVREAASLKEQYKALESVREQYLTFERLEKEIPSLTEKMTGLECKKEKADEEVESKDSILRASEERLEEIKTWNKHVLEIGRLFRENKKVEERMEQCQDTAGDTYRSPDEISEEQNTCADDARAVQYKVDKLNDERNRLTNQLHDLNLQRSNKLTEITQATARLEMKKAKEAELERRRQERQGLEEDVRKAGAELEVIDSEMAKANFALDEARQSGRGKEEKATEERDLMANSVNELKMMERDIRSYVEGGGPAQVLSCQRAIDSLQESIAELEGESEEVTVRINKLAKEVDSSHGKKQNVQDNLSYREYQQEVVGFQDQLRKLRARNAQEDYERLDREHKESERRRESLVAERSHLMGQQQQRRAEIERTETTYETLYKDAKERAKRSRIEVEMMKCAIDDLESYASALEKAIMQYHTLKMRQINEIIAELWQATYQGTDIDTILIRSDDDSGTGAKRNYNYRVCMLKGDTEMDMRGRCSAGQKVLASIIIRLALAESFGANCGIIALDEPTTNLDSDNIGSLARALHDIIDARKKQNNLQLVVITHDEEFLRHMQPSAFCDYFYRVKRDERQNSVIVRESIATISDG